MPHRFLSWLTHHTPACLAIVLAIGLGGGYAFAASSSKTTIHGCVSKHTHLLYIQTGRCRRSQRSITWNQQGLQGVQGVQGRPGAPATAAWATIGSNGAILSSSGNISAQQTGVGTYAVQVATDVCPNNVASPVVTPWGPTASGTFPIASVSGNGRSFTIYTGTVGAGGFAPADGTFNVSVPCD
jgi:hypothetical protein